MAAPGGDQHVYATLLLSDSYLPGALVLAHSLRDARTTKKLAVLVTQDSVSVEAINQLRAVYDYVVPVPRIRNERPANLHLMDRADLHSAFTKINLWKLTQFSKIVYIDADVVAYRAPDELFNIDEPFSAAPDIGWPDLFNSGVMALKPNMGDYYAMIAMSERGISFDGADQGLLNMHFKNNYNRLSFTYNVTPSAHYQYVPAYRHFQSSINMVHFIGSNKPWFEGRNASHGNSPFDEMVGRWWAVYDRHYRVSDSSNEFVRYFTKGEFDPANKSSIGEQQEQQEQQQQQEQGQHDAEVGTSVTHVLHPLPDPEATNPLRNVTEVDTKTETEQVYRSWDAQRHSPPQGSKPEAANFPSAHYAMSQDTAPFVPPNRYPSPPRNMWYDVPKDRAAHTQLPPAIFPWESNRARPARKFAVEPPEPPQPEEDATSTEPELSATETRSGASTPTTPTSKTTTSDPWTSFTRTNAWDDVPEIERHVERLHKHRRGKSGGSIATIPSPRQSTHGHKLTDFPSEVERPSLPVTPAPIHRPNFWGGDAEAHGKEGDSGLTALPAAEGVPAQSDWDPEAQLKKLAQHQSETLLRKLSATGPEEPSTGSGVLSPQPIKGKATTTKLRSGDYETTPTTTIPEPSYSGPGAAWEKNEDILQQETPMPPVDDARDVLDT